MTDPGLFERDRSVRTLLRRRFPPEQIGHLPATPKRPAQDYVGHAAVTDRLNDVAPGWTYTIDEMLTVGGRLWLRITMTVGGVSRPEYGDGENPKTALGNAIRRGAMRFGVALDLWSREELEGYEDSAAPVDGELSTGEDPSPGSSDDLQGTADGRAPTIPLPGGAPASSDAEPAGGTTASDTGQPAGIMGTPGHGDTVGSPAAPPTDTVPLVQRPDWAEIAKDLGTTKTDAQNKVLRFLRTAEIPVRGPSEVDVDLARWAVESLTRGQQEAARR